MTVYRFRLILGFSFSNLVVQFKEVILAFYCPKKENIKEKDKLKSPQL